MLASIVKVNKPQETVQGLGQNGKQSGSGPLRWPDVNTRTAGVESKPKSFLGDYCGTWKRCQPRPQSRPGRLHRKAGQEAQSWEDRKSQGRRVTRRIGPRRSGPSLQENR